MPRFLREPMLQLRSATPYIVSHYVIRECLLQQTVCFVVRAAGSGCTQILLPDGLTDAYPPGSNDMVPVRIALTTEVPNQRAGIGQEQLCHATRPLEDG